MFNELRSIKLEGFIEAGQGDIFRATPPNEPDIKEFVNKHQGKRILLCPGLPQSLSYVLPDGVMCPTWILSADGYTAALDLSVVNYSIIAGAESQGMAYEFLPVIEGLIKQFAALNPEVDPEQLKKIFAVDIEALILYVLR